MAGLAACFPGGRVVWSGVMRGRVQSWFGVGAVFVLWMGLWLTHAEPTVVRLRNETIHPPSKVARAAPHPAPAAPPANGLYLIQFTGPVRPEWRATLRGIGAHLLRYVPENAFVADLENVPLGVVEGLEFVRWVGEYQPRHKVHADLRRPAGRMRAPEAVSVAVLLSGRARPNDVAEVRGAFRSVRQETTLRAGWVLRGELPLARLEALARHRAVLWIEPSRDMKLFDEVSSKIVAGDGGPNRLWTQALGYDGRGVTVAVADSGLHNGDAASMHPDLLGRTPAFFAYGGLPDAADEHSHGTHCAGIIAGNGATGEVDENDMLYGLGVALGARIVAQRIFDGLGNYAAPPSFEKLTRDATRAGAEIGSNSWGDDTGGRYDLSAMEFDELVRDADALRLGDQPYILEFSAGNAGPAARTIGTPAVAKNVIATGATQSDRAEFFVYGDGAETMADFSSRGPCEDGRIKPDLVAPGTWIASLLSASASDLNAWAPISPNYIYMGGTSQAGPHVSGAAAVFVQFYRGTVTNITPSPALVKAALINAAVDMDDTVETGPIPNGDEGWGRLDLTALIGSERDYQFVDQTVPLSTGQFWECMVVVSDAEPFRVTLTYTDVPGLPAVLPALVNDLDLEVIGPGGQVYRGNAFWSGQSVAGAPAADRINNVECVYLPEPAAGPYRVRVRAHHVPEDARGDTPAVDQDFALVISGQLPPAGTGVLSLDRTAYTAPGEIRVRLFDSDLAVAPTAAVQLASSVEPAGETLWLQPESTSGAFTGALATATGPAQADGRLQIAHGGLIEARHFDASFGVTRLAQAVGDLVAPLISGVNATNEFGEVRVRWRTDEPARALVRYGTNAALPLAVTNAVLATDHDVSLGNLTPGRTWYFVVVATDEAGNSATNNNQGALFSIVVTASPTVLLVDHYQDPIFGAPPLSGYTAALNGAGVSYEVWNVAQRGIPTLANLLAHRAVVWRVGEFSGWSAGVCTLVSNYLAGGGALCVASMDLLTRNVETVGAAFNRDVLRVQQFAEDVGAPAIVDAGDPVGAGLDTELDYDVYRTLWFGLIDDISDTFTPAADAVPVLHDGAGNIVGSRWPRSPGAGSGRLVFLSFPLDAVPLAGGTNDRIHLMRNALRFLVPGAEGAGALAFDSPAYTLPSRPQLEVGDSDLAGQSSLTVSVSSSTQTNPIAVTLAATPVAGVFAGSFTLVAATNPAAPDRLRAAHGDTLEARYFDASRGVTVRAEARVDTRPPVISGVEAEPDFVSAVVYWETDEPCDALVQFGESPLSERTSYRPGRALRHAITLAGLRPDTRYYYRVISRDAGGNQTIADNNGQWFTLRTLTPLNAPFVDNMEMGATNWAIFNSEDTAAGWELGAPANGHETAAHSPTNCWGTSLHGQARDYAETFLISPTVFLGGGNTATLTFWHSYDFLPQSEWDIWEAGTVYLITNAVGSPIKLAEFGFDVENWTPVTVDLSPYVGQIVNVVFAYQLLSFESLPRAGWLVDDVAITLATVTPGAVRVTNNLWQAHFILSGPVYRRGRGRALEVTNAPPGQYLIEFGDVPFYQTPAPQTNVLTAGGTLSFHGLYTFADANTNGIPDGWEALHFGVVAPERTAHTDTDGDGMSDWAEFVAGTAPHNPPPPFRLTAARLADGQVNLLWPSVTNHSYRVWVSTNLQVWTPWSGWFGAGGPITSFALPAPTNPVPHFFRVEAAPPGPPNALAPFLRLEARRLPNELLRLEWPSAPGHGYRVLASSNGTNWSPLGDWIRATGYITGQTLPPPGGGMWLFRVEAEP